MSLVRSFRGFDACSRREGHGSEGSLYGRHQLLINKNIPSYHSYQRYLVYRNTLSWWVVAITPLSAQVCVKITPHRTYACTIPSRSKGVYFCVVHAYCVRNGHTSSKPSLWFTVIIHVELCIWSRTSRKIAKYMSDVR